MMYRAARSRTLLAGILMILVAGLGAVGAARAQDEGPWLVTEVTGEAWLHSPGSETRPLGTGDELPAGAIVRSGAGARVILSRGGTTMTLSPNSQTEIPADGGTSGRTTVLQRVGSLLLQVDKRPEQHFEVDTPFLAAVVKGTTFTVSVENGTAAVHVLEGAVEVASFTTGQVAMVRPGQTATVSPSSGGSLKLLGQGTSSGAVRQDAKGRKHAPKADPKNADGPNASAATAEQAGAPAHAAAANAPRGPAKGFTIQQTIGATSIDIATVTDGFIAAAPVAGARAAGAANGTGDGAANGSVTANGSNGKAVGLTKSAVASVGGGVGSVGGGVASVGGGAASALGGGVASMGGGVASVGGGAASALGGAVSAAGGAVAGLSGGLGQTLQSAAGGTPAGNLAQSASQVVQSLQNIGNGNGNGNGLVLGLGLGLGSGNGNN